MKQADLNLARRPFVNRRPVRRLALLLWVLALALVLVNGALYWRHFSGEDKSRERVETIDLEVETETQRLEQLRDELSQLDLEKQNREVEYLNARIAQRTFSWSSLFDRLAEVLPRDVRLYRLAPKVVGPSVDERRRKATAPQRDIVYLTLAGAARSEEALLEFLDLLFAHPSFRQPNLSSEARKGGLIEFNMTVTHLPEARANKKRAKGQGNQPPRMNEGEAEASESGAGENGGDMEQAGEDGP